MVRKNQAGKRRNKWQNPTQFEAYQKTSTRAGVAAQAGWAVLAKARTGRCELHPAWAATPAS
ncbi:hypothetical protein GCM10027278_32640 [Paralcaligenes ginsengisoli]